MGRSNIAVPSIYKEVHGLGSTNTYLFGIAPSSADAILYGYLAPLIKAPFPNPSLQNHVKANDNLWKFVSHINLTYFAKVASDYQRYGNIRIVAFQVKWVKQN